MKYKFNCSYLDDISKEVIKLNNAALTTFILTNTALKIAYKKMELSKEQLELFEADVKAAKNYIWDFVEEENTIKNYLKNLEIQKQLNKLSIPEQLKFYIEQIKEINNVMDLNLSEAEIIGKANMMLNKN